MTPRRLPPSGLSEAGAESHAARPCQVAAPPHGCSGNLPPCARGRWERAGRRTGRAGPRPAGPGFRPMVRPRLSVRPDGASATRMAGAAPDRETGGPSRSQPPHRGRMKGPAEGPLAGPSGGAGPVGGERPSRPGVHPTVDHLAYRLLQQPAVAGCARRSRAAAGPRALAAGPRLPPCRIGAIPGPPGVFPAEGRGAAEEGRGLGEEGCRSACAGNPPCCPPGLAALRRAESARTLALHPRSSSARTDRRPASASRRDRRRRCRAHRACGRRHCRGTGDCATQHHRLVGRATIQSERRMSRWP